jgi:hypothetical protein
MIYIYIILYIIFIFYITPFKPIFHLPGAGGYALPLLQKTRIPEIRGFMGFPHLGARPNAPWKPPAKTWKFATNLGKMVENHEKMRFDL